MSDWIAEQEKAIACEEVVKEFLLATLFKKQLKIMAWLELNLQKLPLAVSGQASFHQKALRYTQT